MERVWHGFSAERDGGKKLRGNWHSYNAKRNVKISLSIRERDKPKSRRNHNLHGGVADFRTDGAIASPGSENMEPAEPTKARRRNYSSVKEIQDKGANR